MTLLINSHALGALPTAWEPVEALRSASRGTVLTQCLRADYELDYLVYLPAEAPPRHVMVVVHGISRNLEEHLEAMRRWADEYQIALVLPRFNSFDFHDYQRLGRDGHGARADLALLKVLDQIREQLMLDVEQVDLFGYSGGAQFAHRFALAHPQRVSRLGIASAGWFTWPSTEVPYPFGLQNADVVPGVRFDLDAFLRMPMCVFVGARDTKRDRALNTTRLIDEMQGPNRHARALNWVKAVREAALQRGIPLSLQFAELPRTTHAYRKAVTRGGLVQKLFDCFYP